MKNSLNLEPYLLQIDQNKTKQKMKFFDDAK
jgi:hypothetical protein